MKYAPLALLLFPAVTYAQTAQSFVTNLTNWLGAVFVPFLIGIAFLFFVINVIRYFVIGAGDKDAQEKARAAATYGVLAFALLVTFWGIINMLTSSLGLECDSFESKDIQSDYMIKDDIGPTAPPC